jgi:type IV secretion system protein VirB1
MDFLALASTCAPAVHPTTITAIVRTESNFDPLVIRDNTLRVTYHPRSQEAAGELLERALSLHHKVAIGLMQVTSSWLGPLHIRAGALLDACTNLAVGSEILAQNYLTCAKPQRSPAEQLQCALSLYWSGTGGRGGAYVNRVYKAAGSPNRMPETPGVTDGVLGTAGPTIPAVTSFTYQGQTFSYEDAPAVQFEFSQPHF